MPGPYVDGGEYPRLLVTVRSRPEPDGTRDRATAGADIGMAAHTGYAPQIKAEVNNHNPPLDALYAPEHAHGYIQDPSHFSLDQYTQGIPAGMNVNGAGGGGGEVGPDRNRPRAARQAAAKRTGACARCRRLKVRHVVSMLRVGITLIASHFFFDCLLGPRCLDEMYVHEPGGRGVLALHRGRVRVRLPRTQAARPRVSLVDLVCIYALCTLR